MSWLPTTVVKLSDVRCPPGPWTQASYWADLQAEPRVKALAANVVDTDGPVNLPVVEAATMEVVSGKHRLAALLVAGRTDAEVRMWQGSAEEKELIRASDNAWPRKDADEWIKRLVDARAKLVASRREAANQDKLSGQKPRKSPRGEAREQVARELGKSTEAVRKAEERAEAKEAPERVVPPTPKPMPVERRLRNLADEAQGMRDPMSAASPDVAAWGGEVAIQYEMALAARADLEAALLATAEAIDRRKAAIRDTDKPEAAVAPPRTRGARLTRKPPSKRLDIEDAEGKHHVGGEDDGEDGLPF